MIGRITALVLGALWLAAPVAAQAPETVDSSQQQASTQSPYPISDQSWKQHRFHVGAFGGRLTGGTPLGTTENPFFREQFETDGDTLFGFRVGWRFVERFELEIEYGRSEPGLSVVLSDLRGRRRTEVPFADLTLNYVTASVLYSMIEPSRRLVPYLALGLGVADASSDAEAIIDASEASVIFGAGLRVRALDRVFVRADLRGLRTGFGSKQPEGQLPSIFRGGFKSSNLLWTFGLEVGF